MNKQAPTPLARQQIVPMQEPTSRAVCASGDCQQVMHLRAQERVEGSSSSMPRVL